MPEDKDTLFGRLAVERGYLTQEKLDEACELQRKMRDEMGMNQPLVQVLVSKEWLTLDQAQELRNAASVETGEASIVAGYQVIAKLGEGGMGAVYKAKKLDTGELVALKILPPSLATEGLIKRFTREAEITSKLNHEHIVGCVEFGQDPKRKCWFCALELIDGEDLGKLIERKGRLDEAEAVSIAKQIASALEHAFTNGLVHRDVKPENVMVTPAGNAKLLDLGLARPASVEATRFTQSGMFVGSPYYASPEQAMAERDIDIRSDIYSLGATLYHMVTGKPPFEGTTALAILQKHVGEKVPWPADVNPELSDGVCRVIARMMAKDPAHRYQELRELLRDLDALAAGLEPEIGLAPLHDSSVAPALKPRVRQPRPAPRARREGRAGMRPKVRAPAPSGGAGKWIGLAAVAAAGVVVAVVLLPRWRKPRKPVSRARRTRTADKSVGGDTTGTGTSKPTRKGASVGARPPAVATRKASPPRDDAGGALSAQSPAASKRSGTRAPSPGLASPDSGGKGLRPVPPPVSSRPEEGSRPRTGLGTKGAVASGKLVKDRAETDALNASLTVVSEPLEARVFLDTKECGKTPLTLENLAHGRHQLVLLKAGYPKTARSVYLKPGEERVLEVKLGVPGRPEKEDNAQPKTAGQRAPDSVPVGVQLILTMLREAAVKDDFAETRQNLTLALNQPDMGAFKAELRAAIGVVRELEGRREAIVRAAEELVGKEVTLKTKAGSRKGKVEGVSFEGITMVLKIIVGGRALGESRGVVKWSALALAEQDRLAESWKPEGPDGAVARAVLALARKDRAAAELAARAAGDHPLGKYLGAGSEVAGTAEDDPNEVWAPLEKRCSAKRITVAEEMALDREICAFRDRYGKARLDPSLRRRIRLAAERAKRASGLVGYWTFDEGGGAVARDSSGRGHHGRIHGSRWVKGTIGGALEFDGRDDHVRLSAGFADFTSGITIALWANPMALKKWARFVELGDGRDRDNISLSFWGTTPDLRLEIYRGHKLKPFVRAYGAIELGQWQHFVGVVDGSANAVLYKNGGLIATGRVKVPLNRQRRTNWLGRSSWREDEYYMGRMDDVRIYNRALSAEEVKALAIQGE